MCPPEAVSLSEDSKVPHPVAMIEGLIPNTKTSKIAFDHASSLLAPAILNHSVRVYLYAKAIADQTDSVYAKDISKHDLLFTACLFHDIGTSKNYDGPQRFEVEGADAAVSLLTSLGVAAEDAHQVWMAIALHTSAGIAERINEVTRIVRNAVITDFGRNIEGLERLVCLRGSFEAKLPRLSIERVLGDAVVKQAVENPGKAPPASWPHDLYKAYLAEPDREGTNPGF